MKLTPNQLKAVTSNRRNIVVLAGAGSGKTGVLCERINHVLSVLFIPPERLAVVTFTNQAANEIKRRVSESYAGEQVNFGYCGTLHGYALQLLRTYHDKVGLPDRITVIDEEQATEMLKDTMFKMGSKLSIKAALEIIKTEPVWDAQAATPPQLLNCYYYREMQYTGALTYDAILVFMARLASLIQPDEFAQQWLFVDEVQDSSNLDFQIYQRLPFLNKFMVGDTDQAIYSFRGGNVFNILGFIRDNADEVITLDDNFRCAHNIVKAAQTLIQNNRSRYTKTMTAFRLEQGVVKFFLNVPTQRHEVNMIATAFEKLPADSTKAVLCRTNFIVKTVTEQLQSMGLYVARRVAIERPADWKTVTMFISLLAAPHNDMLAYSFVKYQKGKAAADAVKREAMAAYETIDRHYLRLPPVEPEDVPNILVVVGISRESVAEVKRVLAEVRPRTMPELSLALLPERVVEEEFGVNVLTMHAAKGREWDVVALVGCDDQIIPGRNGVGTVSEEERRLMFVAITRAKNVLIATSARERVTGDWARTPIPMEPSRFLSEADPAAEFVQSGERVAVQQL